MAPHVFFVLFNSNHQAVVRNDALFIMERRPYVFPYNCTRSYSDGVALTLTLTVGVVGLKLRGARLLGQIFIKKEPPKKNYLPNKFVKRTVR